LLRFAKPFLSTVHYFAGLEREGLLLVSRFAAFLKDDTATAAIEYGLIAAGISVAIVVVVNAIATNLNSKLDSIASR